MAEIPIERKPRRSVGPLLIILIVILLAVAGWYWWMNYGSRKETAPSTTSTTSLIHLASGAAPVSHFSNLRRV
jgi:TRAP-type C4-dicarboxylate transport system permease small subunit